MQSKRSFFNVTLFKKNLSRSWPLWGVVTAAGCLVPLYMLLALIQYGSRYNELRIAAEDFREMLYGVATYFVPAASLGYAILIAMVVWSYLYNTRSVGLMHTLPIDRTGLFVTNTLSGFAMMLIPYAVVGLFICVIAVAWGFMDLMAVAATIAAVLLMTVLFFGMATLCAMITGNIFALPAFYLVLNFIAPAMDWLISILAQSFLLGVDNDYTGAVEFLSPVVEIYQNFQWDGRYVAPDDYQYHLVGFGTVAIYGLVGLAMLGLALMLYLRRKSERSGDVVAFRWLRPVFRYGVALVSALTLGRLLYALIWESLFQSGDYAEAIPMAVCMAIAGLVGYYAASMLLEKSLRVFRGSAPGAAAVAVACAVICVGTSMDLLGVEGYVPETEDINTVYLYASDMVGNSPTLSAADDPELVEMVRGLHAAIVDQAQEIKDDQSRGYAVEYSEGEQVEYTCQFVRIEYRLKDGSFVQRRYNLYLKREAWENDTGFEGAFKKLFTSTDFQMRQIMGNAEGDLELAHIWVYDHDGGKDSAYLDTDKVYEALVTDARAGNLYDYDPFDDYYNDSYPVSIDVEYRVVDEEYYDGYHYDYTSISLRPTMVNTIQELMDQKFITLEQLQQWDEERALEVDYSKYEMPVAVEIGG